jgi:hypothetical protein
MCMIILDSKIHVLNNILKHMGLVLLYVVPLFQSMNNIAQRHV